MNPPVILSTTRVCCLSLELNCVGCAVALATKPALAVTLWPTVENITRPSTGNRHTRRSVAAKVCLSSPVKLLMHGWRICEWHFTAFIAVRHLENVPAGGSKLNLIRIFTCERLFKETQCLCHVFCLLLYRSTCCHNLSVPLPRVWAGHWAWGRGAQRGRGRLKGGWRTGGGRGQCSKGCRLSLFSRQYVLNHNQQLWSHNDHYDYDYCICVSMALEGIRPDSVLSTALAEADLEEMAMCETEDNKVFQRFKKKIAPEPHQVKNDTIVISTNCTHIIPNDWVTHCAFK